MLGEFRSNWIISLACLVSENRCDRAARLQRGHVSNVGRAVVTDAVTRVPDRSSSSSSSRWLAYRPARPLGSSGSVQLSARLTPLSSQFLTIHFLTIAISHFTQLTSSNPTHLSSAPLLSSPQLSHLNSSHLISPHITSSHLSSVHRTHLTHPRHLIVNLSLDSAHLISSYLRSPHLT